MLCSEENVTTDLYISAGNVVEQALDIECIAPMPQLHTSA